MNQARQSITSILVIASGLTVFLGGCASRGGPIPYDVSNFGKPATEIRTYPREQVIGPLDEITVDVFQVEDLSGVYKVNQEGTLTLPLVGRFAAQGLTSVQLSQQIADRLSREYVRDPFVQVSVTEAAPKTFSLDGAVQSPGAYPLKGQTTLMEAVAAGGGLAAGANPSRVVVFRTIDGERMAAAFDLQAIRRAQGVDPVVYGNDIIVVDGDRIRAAFVDVLSAISVIGVFQRF